MDDRLPSVLVIDDDRSLLLGLQAILKRAGYQVLIASSGNDGLTLAEENRPDVIVCDVMMPPPNGLEVRRALSRKPDVAVIPFIFLTARVSQADKIQGIELGADDYITKPFDRDELLVRIKAVLRRDELSREQGRLEAEVQMQRLRRVVARIVGQALGMAPNDALVALNNILEDKFGPDVQQQHTFVQQALDDEPHLNALVEDLILLSRLDRNELDGERVPVNLDEELYHQVERCARVWQSREVNLSINVEPGVVVRAPAGSLGKAVVRHLVDNAFKYSPVGGQVSIALKGSGPGGCKLSVSDEGPGIAPDLRERVFDRFFQGEPPSEPVIRHGLGVGLTIAREFARALNGDVTVEDVTGGCTVQFALPPV